jgi:acetoin utilization protein AcuB
MTLHMTVDEMMTTAIKTMREDEAVGTADWEMAIEGIHHILILGEDGKLIGIVSDRDILRAGREAANSTPVGRIMRRDVTTVRATTPAIEAIELLLAGRFHALPVVDGDDRPVGIVTTTDILEVAKWVLHGLDAKGTHRRVG